jgi:hypothetical protein
MLHVRETEPCGGQLLRVGNKEVLLVRNSRVGNNGGFWPEKESV